MLLLLLLLCHVLGTALFINPVCATRMCYSDLFRKLLQMVVGAPRTLNWSRPWHEILHERNMNFQTIASEHQVT